MGKSKVIISDVHLGEGREGVNYNPWQEFQHDALLCEFLQYYSSGRYGATQELELILAGDFVDFLQIRHDAAFPLAVTEDISLAKLEKCRQAHPMVWAGLSQFLAQPGKTLTILPGNHDVDFYFLPVRQLFVDKVAGPDCAHKVKFCLEGSYFFDGVLIQHGHEWEASNQFEHNEATIQRPDGKPILNFPFGSLYQMMILNQLKRDRPYITKVNPLQLYLLRSLWEDTGFALKFIAQTIYCLLQTRRRKFLGQNISCATTWKIIGELCGLCSGITTHVRQIFAARPDVQVFISGHSHAPMIRCWGKKLYLNTGCWVDNIYLGLPHSAMSMQKTYALLEYTSSPQPEVYLMAWHGTQSVARELLF